MPRGLNECAGWVSNGGMKTMLAALAALALAINTARPQALQEPPLVSTTGTAEIKIVPDLADLAFEVEVRNADLTAARKQQAERTIKVLAALRAAGVAEADLQAADISISPNFTENRRDYAETAKVRFFSVSQRVAVTLRDLKKVPDVIAAAVSAGATELSSLALRTTDLRKHRDAARAAAIKAAKEKATALAAELGAKIGKPHRISEQAASSAANWGNLSFNNAQVAVRGGDDPDAGAGGAAFAPGTISISATVAVSFLLE